VTIDLGHLHEDTPDLELVVASEQITLAHERVAKALIDQAMEMLQQAKTRFDNT